MPDVTRIFLLDDHRLVLDGLRQLLDSTDDIRVCGTACSLAEARAGLAAARPDILMVDLSLPDGSGLDLMHDPAVAGTACRVIVLSMRDENFYALQAIQCGARGFISKSSASSDMLAAIRTVRDGHIHVSAPIATALIERARRPRQEPDSPPVTSVQSLLGRREMTVFEMIGRGLTTREIAASLGISPKTVDTHRQRIRAKLHVTSAARLTALAIQWTSAEAQGTPAAGHAARRAEAKGNA